MANTRYGATTHDGLSGVDVDDHHAEIGAADLNLDDLGEKDHASLASVSTSQHHARYADAEAVAAVEAVAALAIQGQVNFPDSQSASADVNTLDDYEEGTWTPTLADDSLDGTGESQAYSVQVGRYTKIGNRVFVSFHLATSSIGSMTGGNSVNILGLPFAPLNLADSNHSLVCSESSGLAITAGDTVVARVYRTHAYVTLYVWTATTGTTAMTITQWSADGNLICSGVYESAT